MYKDKDHYTLYRRNGIWGYYYYDEDNRRHYRSTGRRTKYDAQKVISERIRDGELSYGKSSSSLVFSEYTTNFFVQGKCPIQKQKLRAGSPYSVTTMKLYRGKLDKDLIPFFGQKLISNIDKRSIEAFEDMLIKEGHSNKTITIKTDALRAIMGYAKKMGDIKTDPFEDHVKLHEETSHRQAFTLEQVQMLLDGPWSNIIVKLIFQWACLTGMRLGEIQALKVGSVSDGIITVSESFSQECGVEKDTKNHKTREIPLPEALKETVEFLSKDKTPDMLLFSEDGVTHMGKWNIIRGLQRRKIACGIDNKNLVFHSCRHFFDTYMGLQSGLSPEKVMAIMGHQSLEMYQHYLHVMRTDLGEIKEAQDKLTTKLTTSK